MCFFSLLLFETKIYITIYVNYNSISLHTDFGRHIYAFVNVESVSDGFIRSLISHPEYALKLTETLLVSE